MSGTAEVTFTCGATVSIEARHWVSGKVETYPDQCPETVQRSLVIDGKYIFFNTPENWHIELGTFDADKTIVRCPKHCKWVGGEGGAWMGHWEDAP